MPFKKIKNGYEITVAKWSDVISVKNLSTGEVTSQKFPDHVQAVALAKQL